MQNPALRQIVDESGCVRTTYNQNPLPVQNQPVTYDQAIIPTKPADNLPAIDSLEPAMQRLIVSARLLFEKRPIWTRRALINSVSSEDYKVIGSNSAKYIYQYVGYVFESGPWRDAVVKFGVDPRKDPSLRFYQTMMFMLDPEYSDHRRRKAKDMEWGRNSTLKSTSKVAHIFDGLTVGLDGKVWQVCDITDPLLESLLSTTNIRDECHVRSPLSFFQTLFFNKRSKPRFKEMAGFIVAHGPKPKSS